MKAIESSLAIFSIETADKNKVKIKGGNHGTEAAKKYSIRLELCVLIILKIYEPKKVFCCCGLMKLRLHDGLNVKKTVAFNVRLFPLNK